MKRTFVFRLQAIAALLMAAGTVLPTAAQDMPQHKVDISITNRNDDETLEPGYTVWRVAQGTSDTKVIDGVTYTLSIPAGAPYELRTGWSKSYIQNADNKAKNGRLTFDGIALDPTNQYYGTITLKITGLPVGTHTIQTYHNNWENPANWYCAPMTVKCNGNTVHQNVMPTFGQNLAANACLLSTNFTIANAGDAVELEFSTSEENPGSPDNGQKNYYMVPLCNGFELNTVNVASLAKDPYPADGDMHVDADSKSLTLRWSPANENMVEHQLHWGTDSATVAQSTAPMATLTDTLYQVNDLYSMNTYYWRVDEVDASGNATKGQVWSFKPRQLAFPGAEGYGRFAQGGRGGSVYHVTSLSGGKEPGTFLYGILNADGPRTIVFDVSGIIELDFESYFTKPYITIAGQTAPGKGVCIKKANIGIAGDNICRHMRFKHGYGDTGNAMGLSGADHTIVDHTTAAWGTDETMASRGAKMVTFQYSMIAEALGIADHKNYGSGTNHGFAATIDGKIGSYHHNLLVNCNGRNWSLGGGMDGTNTAIGQMDIFNNVVYNWWGRTTDGNCHELNFVNNYYKMGPDTKRTELLIQQYENVGSAESTWRAYVSGNIRENKNGTLTYDKKGDTYTIQLSNGDPGPKYETIVDQPFFPSYATIHSAKDALKIVTSEAGATMPVRDEQHVRVVNETVKGTYTYVGSRSGIKGEIDHEDDAGGWEIYPEETRSADFDTDQDGMPDWYEELINSDANTANNNDDPDRDGWTLLEDYLEFMANPYLIVKTNSTGKIDMAPHFKGFTKSPVFTVNSSSGLFTASVSSAEVTVNTKDNGGIGIVTVKVTDSEGTSYEKRLSIAVTNNAAAINSINDDNYEVAKREYFTIDGKRASSFVRGEVYIIKVTDTNGKVHTMKAIKN